MSLKGNPSTLTKLAATLRQLPKTLAARVASKVAPDLTAQTQAAFASGRNVYGDARPAGVNGQPLTLEKSGATRGSLKFVSVGTRVRASLGTRYARYLIGKYKILPAAGSAMPVAWQDSTAKIARAEIERGLAGAT